MEKKGKQKDNEKMRGSWELVLVTVLSRSGTSARLCPFPFSLSLLGFDDFSSSHFLFFPRVGVLALFVCVFFFFFFAQPSHLNSFHYPYFLCTCWVSVPPRAGRGSVRGSREAAVANTDTLPA